MNMKTKAPENKLVEMLRKAREAKDSAPRVETVLDAAARRRPDQERTSKCK